MSHDVKYLLTCLLVLYMSSMVRHLLRSLAHFLIPLCQVGYSYQLPIPGEDSMSMEDGKEHHHANHQEGKSKHSFPLLLGFRVTKAIITWSSTGWNNTSLTSRRDRARSASTVGVSPPWPECLSPSVATVGGTCPLPLEDG